MATRALELLSLPTDGVPRLILDLGCGSGISGGVLSAAGHGWLGMDISESMLQVAREDMEMEMEMETEMDMAMDESDYEHENDSDGNREQTQVSDLLLHDMGQGVCFRPGTFDGCISISALQWLFHSNRSYEHPKRRLLRLFSTLQSALTRSARAILQFYPSNAEQIDMALSCASKAGFSGGVVVDYPNSTKAKKYYLCLMTGGSGIAMPMPRGLTEQSLAGMDESESEEETVEASVSGRAETVKIGARQRQKLAKVQKSLKDRNWVMRKKELYRRRGKEVKEDSRYTARKRRPRF